MPSEPIIIEEPWLEITTRTGLKIECPGTAKELLATYEAHPTFPVGSKFHYINTSRITGETYLVDTSEYVHIRQYTRRHDPERLERSVIRASRSSSPISAVSSQKVASPSAIPASPSSAWRGASPSRTTH